MYTVRFARYAASNEQPPFVMAVVTDMSGIRHLFREVNEDEMDLLICNVTENHLTEGEISYLDAKDIHITIEYKIEEMF